MATTAWTEPQTSSTGAFTTPDNLLVDDVNFTYPNNNTPGDVQNWITFEDASSNSLESLITTGATIDGIEIEVRAKDSYDGTGAFGQAIFSPDAGSTYSSSGLSAARIPASGTLPSGATTYTIGGATEKFGLTLSKSSFSAANFIFRLRGDSTDGYAADFNVEYMRLRVHYTVGGGGSIIPLIMHHRNQMK